MANSRSNIYPVQLQGAEIILTRNKNSFILLLWGLALQVKF